MLGIRHDFALGVAIGAERVSYDSLRRTSLLARKPRQQTLRGLCVLSDLHDFVEPISIVINGTLAGARGGPHLNHPVRADCRRFLAPAALTEGAARDGRRTLRVASTPKPDRQQFALLFHFC
jgi:hypothetical protein